MQDTAEAIAQLATATASYRGTVATLAATNAKLATQLEAAHALIAQLKSEIATLKIKIKIKPVWQGQRPARAYNVRKSGHQETATKVDTMGGVQWGK
jgi:hypothetical protein